MINATVSHELRNPLNSMIGNIVAMEEHYKEFEKCLEELKKIKSPSLTSRLTKVYDGIKVCCKKMTSAAKFVDFFVHDILDYTILNKDDKNFTQTISVFDVREAIQEIVEI